MGSIILTNIYWPQGTPIGLCWRQRCVRWGRQSLLGNTVHVHTHKCMAKVVKNPPAVQETQETGVQSLGREEPLEEEIATHSSILSCLENSMDREVWHATVHRVPNSQTWLSIHAMDVKYEKGDPDMLSFQNASEHVAQRLAQGRHLNTLELIELTLHKLTLTFSFILT